MTKIYIIGGNPSYNRVIQDAIVVSTMEEADIAVLTGGEDVTPSLYKEKAHPTTGNNPHRDMQEMIEVRKAIDLKIPILAICRGSQLGTAISGGKLVQNVKGQPYIHTVKDVFFKESYEVTSTHHQMMYPFNLEPSKFKILAYAENLTKVWEGLPMGCKIPKVEPEIVYYPQTKILACQGHPEYKDAPKRFQEIITLYTQKLINNEL